MKHTPLHVLVIEDDLQDTEILRELLLKESKEPVELQCVDRMQSGLNSLKKNQQFRFSPLGSHSARQ